MREAIESALNQTYSNVEIIVVNDGSNDNGTTAAIAKSYGNRIRYYEKKNGGVASALNLGLKEMHGEYFSWLSHDDKYAPEKIQKQIQLLSHLGDPKAIISCGVCYINTEGKAIGLFHPYDFYSKEKLKRPLFPLLHGCINGCSLLIHRSHFESVGLFNENLPTTQDYDLWFRMLRHQSVIFHPDILIMTRIHKKQGSNNINHEHLRECDNLWISMLSSLTMEEINRIDDNEYQFYRGIYKHLVRNSYYEDAIHYTWIHLQKALDEAFQKGIYTKSKYTRMKKKDDRMKELIEYDKELARSNRLELQRWLISLQVEGIYTAMRRLIRVFQLRFCHKMNNSTKER